MFIEVAGWMHGLVRDTMILHMGFLLGSSGFFDFFFFFFLCSYRTLLAIAYIRIQYVHAWFEDTTLSRRYLVPRSLNEEPSDVKFMPKSQDKNGHVDERYAL